MLAVMGVFNFSILLLILGQLVIHIDGSGVSYAYLFSYFYFIHFQFLSKLEY